MAGNDLSRDELLARTRRALEHDVPHDADRILQELEYATGLDTRARRTSSGYLAEPILTWPPVEAIVDCMNELENRLAMPRVVWAIESDPTRDVQGDGRITAMRLSIAPLQIQDRELVAIARWIFRNRDRGDASLTRRTLVALQASGIPAGVAPSLADVEPDGDELVEPWTSIDLAVGALERGFPKESLPLQLWRAVTDVPRAEAMSAVVDSFPATRADAARLIATLAEAVEGSIPPRIRRHWALVEEDGEVLVGTVAWRP